MLPCVPELFMNLRSTEGLKNVRIIAMSGVLDSEDLNRMDVKPDLFLQKPLNANDIEAALADLA